MFGLSDIFIVSDGHITAHNVYIQGFFLLQEVFHVYLNKFENVVTHLYSRYIG